MGLGNYFRKRHFGKTPEPRGAVKTSSSKRLAFVVQEHHASRLHYDFRLELDGVLKSWAVPKGPSMNPHDRHLAVAVEDHPYEYRKFEGVIPNGHYGAGNVIVWDEGWYEPRAEGVVDQEAELRQGLHKGHLTFVVHGKKLRGEFALIKMHGQDEDAWLLIKKGDAFASEEDITKNEASVKSGLRVDDIKGSHKLPDLSAYPKKASVGRVHPMLCTLVAEPFSREGWLFEIKWDGYRAIGVHQKSKVQLYSRTGQDFSLHYPEIAEALRTLGHDVVLDGEIVVIGSDGHPHFEHLQNWRRSPNPKGHLIYVAFDILWYGGHDLRNAPLSERKRILHVLLSDTDGTGILRYGDHIATQGEALFNEMQKQGLEGIVAKDAQSRYHENERGSKWLKIKTHLRQEVVIGGFTEPRGGRKYLGSLLVGIYKNGQLVYAGHSGGGIPDDQRRLLREQLEKLIQVNSPFSEQPKPNAPVHWLQPRVVCEMSFSEWTNEGLMRHPVFEGLRNDKRPADVHKDTPKKKSPGGLRKLAKTEGKHMTAKAIPDKNHFEFTHLEKIFFPKHAVTKGNIIEYYRAVAPFILPYIKDRPLSLLRQPNGITGEGFFQKNMEHLPAWVPAADIFSESHNGTLHWMVGGTLEALLYAVQLGSIEINPWNSRIGQLDKPDWVVIDLDPEGTITFKNVIRVARTVKAVCDDWGAGCFVKTSGKTGLHIYLPMGAKYTYEQARNFAHLLVIEVHKREPVLTSIERTPAKRPNKIYLDWLQNREGQTLAAPYSLRPVPDASVSMPLAWEELVLGLRPTDFTIKNVLARLKKTGDIWRPVMGKGIDLIKIIQHIQRIE